MTEKYDPGKATLRQASRIVSDLDSGAIDRGMAQAIIEKKLGPSELIKHWLYMFTIALGCLIKASNQRGLIELYFEFVGSATEYACADEDFQNQVLLMAEHIENPWILAAIAGDSSWKLETREMALGRIKDENVLVRLLAYLLLGPNSITATNKDAEQHHFAADKYAETLIRRIFPNLSPEMLKAEWGVWHVESTDHVRELVMDLGYLLSLAFRPLIEPQEAGYKGWNKTWSEDHYITSALEEIAYRRHAHRHRRGEVNLLLSQALRDGAPGLDLDAIIQYIQDPTILMGVLVELGDDSPLKPKIAERIEKLNKPKAPRQEKVKKIRKH